MKRWRVESAGAGGGWVTISPEGQGEWWSSWRTAYRYALVCAGGRP